MMRVRVSAERVADEVLAVTALAATGSGAEEPPLLTADAAAMIERCARGAFGRVATGLARWLAGSAAEGLEMVLTGGGDGDAETAARAVEHVVALDVAAGFCAGPYPQTARELAAAREAAAGALRVFVESRQRGPGRIRAYEH